MRRGAWLLGNWVHDTIVRWDIIEAALAGLFGLVLTVQLWKTHQALQKETMERQHA